MNDYIDLDPILLRPQAPEKFSVKSFLGQLLSSVSCANVPKSEMASGGDISEWQGEMDWNAYFDNGMQFTIIRAMINGRIDAQFERNAQILSDQKRPFLVYGATGYPTLSNAIPYARALANFIDGVPYLGIWDDSEASGLLNPYEMAKWNSEFLGELTVLVPNTILEIYTRQSFWDSSVQAGNWSKYPLAAARYNTSLTCPWSDGLYQFRDWTTWRWWQDSQWWDGKKFGAKTTYIDHDYFNGTLDDLKATYNVGTEPTDPELEARVKTLEDQMIVVNTRLDALEAKSHEHSVIEPDTLIVEILDQHKAHYFKDTDKACEPNAGKPIMLTADELAPLKVGDTYECNPALYLHCKDDPSTPTTKATGNAQFYRIQSGPYQGKFIRADKSKPQE